MTTVCKRVRLKQGTAELICWLPAEGLPEAGQEIKLKKSFDGYWKIAEIYPAIEIRRTHMDREE